MKTYRLIKIYPGSKELGYILKQVNNGQDKPNNYYQNGIWFNPSEHPEHWQEVKEVVEKDYLITGYYQKPNNIHINPIGNFSKGFETDYEIYQVKRISDGEVFTIGDKAINNTYSQYCGIISEIFIKDNKLQLYLSETIAGNMSLFLNNAKKHKQPLFTTEDGVDIFEGSDFYSTRKDGSGSIIKYNGHHLEPASKKCKDFVDFSTKEKAEEYILMNKPCLSFSDIYDNLKIKDREFVLKFIKSKIK